MKKFVIFILCFLLCVGIGGSAFVIAKNMDANTSIEQSDSSMDDNTTDDGSGEVGDMNNGNTGNTDEAPESAELTAPANEASLIAEGLEMQTGASLYVGDESERPAMRFSCNVTAELKAEVDADENKQIAMLVMPVKYFDKVNTENYTYKDWVNAFDAAGETSYILSVFEDNYYTSGDNYFVRFRLEDIPFGGINMEVAALGVLITTNSDGTKSYQYSSFPDGLTYRSNARSVAYVASASLNAHTLGLETFTDTQLEKIKGYVNESVDKANGLTEATDDGSMYAFTVSPSSAQTLSIGETVSLSVVISPNVNVPIWYRSTDESVVTVDDNGKITAIKAGTAVIGVYVAGEAFGVTITVS